MNFRSIIWVTCYMLLMVACKDKPASKPEPAKAEIQREGDNVSLTEEQMKGAGVSIGTLEMKNLTSVIKVNGTLEVPNENKALITSLAGGVLQSLKVHPGDRVSKGQVIGTIANSEVSGVQQHLISINSQLNFAEKERQRQSELVAGNAAPMKNLQKVEAEIKSLQAQRSALRRQLDVLGVQSAGPLVTTIAIKAPISGNISEISAEIGSNITANAPIAEVVNNSELHLALFVYEKDLAKVASGQTIHFTVINNPNKVYDARIFAVGTAFAKDTKAVPVHAHVINDKGGLVGGMSVAASIGLGHDVYPAVPDDAVVNNGGKDYIFVLSESSERAVKGGQVTTFRRVQVVRGISDVGYTQIQPVISLPEGTKIAVRGSFFLMAKMTNTGEGE